MSRDVGAALARTSQAGQSADALALLDEVPLTEAEAGYVEAARAANTLRGHRSDWREFTTWAAGREVEVLPAAPATITGYLSDLAAAGAKVGTMSRRLSAIKFTHQLHELHDPTTGARLVAVWEGIRRTHSAPPVQSTPLMPPLLFDVLDACPSAKTWRTCGREPEPDLAGLRDRALILLGFVAALRRSEIAAIDVGDVAEHPNGLVIAIARSKTNQVGHDAELVVLPRAANPERCPVIAIARAGIDPTTCSAHSLRAGFVTYAHLRGSSDRAIAHRTRHRSLVSVGTYSRVHTAWTDNAATTLGL